MKAAAAVTRQHTGSWLLVTTSRTPWIQAARAKMSILTKSAVSGFLTQPGLASTALFVPLSSQRGICTPTPEGWMAGVLNPGMRFRCKVVYTAYAAKHCGHTGSIDAKPSVHRVCGEALPGPCARLPETGCPLRGDRRWRDRICEWISLRLPQPDEERFPGRSALPGGRFELYVAGVPQEPSRNEKIRLGPVRSLSPQHHAGIRMQQQGKRQ